MLPTLRSRAAWQISRRAQVSARRTFAVSANNRQEDPNSLRDVKPVSKSNVLPVESGQTSSALQEDVDVGERARVMQAPNRATTWARSQEPRAKAMSGPRFEQTIMEAQPAPMAAISLIHQQPVRWTHESVVSCDGGGGPLGHPRIFINTDKPEITPCGYCGLPFANEHNRAHLESLETTPYPLEPLGRPAEVQENQRITDEGLGQR
ncbi:Uncharacterized protein BP5553_05618 [Venustampulla echinocandica]|uniref:Zinc finger CHCC-type domain-containing protein n=1 Tax=Venustampulla echinocandica TaxID=2656787 RepID=A0A370TRM3_9HELO|nr:Uncharacterized protein BP5553_05618 [Venustampulla echinocandica]RDL38185.1 Uncharacterized protein BP5553_05618 [Venustampulla echinocandica]